MTRPPMKILQERNLDFLAQNKDGFQFIDTFFPYTSGEIGSYFVESTAIQATGKHYSLACNDMCFLICANISEGDFQVVSGGESRDWMFSYPVAKDFVNAAHAKLYKNGKVLGADMKGKKVIHVADLNDEGSSPRDSWVPAIKKAGGSIEDIFFYVDRLEDGAKVMKEIGLKSHAVVPLDEHAWDYLQKIGIVSKEVYNSLMKRMEDKDTWAKDMLRSDAGIEKFVELALDPNTRSKVDNIMIKGYPDMKEELIGILTNKTNLDMDAWVKGM